LTAAATSVSLPDQGERITLPSGHSLFYFDADHSYWRVNDQGSRGRRLTGVTTVCKTLDHDPSRLLKWAAETQCIGVVELAKAYGDRTDWLCSQEVLLEELRRHALTFEDVKDRAGKRGTNVHRDVFEALATGRELPDLGSVTFDERMAAEGVIRFWREEQPEAFLVEQIVYSERLGVAGRLDFYGRIKSRPGVGIIDLKTGGFLSAAAHAQVGGGYPMLVTESGWDAPDWAAMLQVKDGGYTLVEAEGTPESFEAAVACYREAGRINGAATKARKAREAA
jgi:hypothetical protein